MRLVMLFNITQERSRCIYRSRNITFFLNEPEHNASYCHASHVRNVVLAFLKCMKNRLFSFKKNCVLTKPAKIFTREKCSRGRTSMKRLWPPLWIRFFVWKSALNWSVKKYFGTKLEKGRKELWNFQSFSYQFEY